jgi:hypothetical protein
MTEPITFEHPRVTLAAVCGGLNDPTVDRDDVKRLAPHLSCTRSLCTFLAENTVSTEDLWRMMWMELGLRDVPRPSMVRRLQGRLHTRERNRMAHLLKEAAHHA